MRENNDVTNKPDLITQIGEGSVIQHGKLNDRIYLMKLAARDIESIARHIVQLAAKYNYSKLFCKVPGKAAPLFFAEGYILEGHIPGFYRGSEDAFFVSKFLNATRQHLVSRRQLKTFYRLLHTTTIRKRLSGNPRKYTIRRLDEHDVLTIATLYSDVFESYPFPIYDPVYIAKTMLSGCVQYFGAFRDGQLVAQASAEIDFVEKNAEMTDFATPEQYAGNNLSYLLLEAMEQAMRNLGIVTLYTIARLNSVAINKTFLRYGYEYAGTLVNNTNIAGKIESMNLLYKRL